MDSCPEPWERQAARLYKVEDYSQSNDVYREYSRSPEPHGERNVELGTSHGPDQLKTYNG